MISPVSPQIPDPAALLQALIRFDTSNPPGQERACIEFIRDLVQGVGVEPTLVGADPERPNLVARVKGRGEAPGLLLHGHVDVVGANPAEWVYPPFGGDLVDGEVWGRGALDMKGGVAMMLWAFLGLAASGERPPGDVVFAALADEEAGSMLGASHLVERHPSLLDGVRFAIGEGGGFRINIGGVEFFPVHVAEKRGCYIEASIRGRGGHASQAVRDEVMGRLGRTLHALDSRRAPVHMTPLARTMFQAMEAELPNDEGAFAAAALAGRVEQDTFDLTGAHAPMFNAIVRNTATPTMVRSGEAYNVAPTEAFVTLDGRLLPGFGAAELQREIQVLVGDDAEIRAWDAEPEPPAPDISLLPAVSEAVTAHYPGATPVPFLFPAGTDARFFARLGIQTYGCLPARAPATVTGGFFDSIHAPDERVSVDDLRAGAHMVADLLPRLGRAAGRSGG